MSSALGWTLVVLFALVMAGVVAGTIRLAEVMVERTIRQGLGPLGSELRELRVRLHRMTRP